MHVRFSPNATVGDQTVIRRFLPIATERSAAKNRYSITSSARASSVAARRD